MGNYSFYIAKHAVFRSQIKYEKKIKRNQVFFALTTCVVSIFCLTFFARFMLIVDYNNLNVSNENNFYATMLYYNENIGGYILVAVFAFMLGTIVTVACLFYKNRQEKIQKNFKEMRGIYEKEDN